MANREYRTMEARLPDTPVEEEQMLLPQVSDLTHEAEGRHLVIKTVLQALWMSSVPGELHEDLSDFGSQVGVYIYHLIHVAYPNQFVISGDGVLFKYSISCDAKMGERSRCNIVIVLTYFYIYVR